MQKAATLLAKGRPDEALPLARKVISAGGAVPVAAYELSAQSALATGQLRVAIESIEGAIRVGGATLERVLFYGDLLLRSGQWQSAADVFQQVIKQQDGNATAWMGLAHCLFSVGDWVRAESAYLAVLERDPGNLDARARMACCLLNQGDAGRALPLLREVLEKRPEDAETNIWMAEALRRTDAVEDAIEIFRRWQNDKQVGERARRSLLWCWFAIEDYSEVEPVLKGLLGQHPEDPELNTLRARLLAVDGKRAEAQQALHQVISQHVGFFTAWEPYMDTCQEPLGPALYEQLRRALKLATDQHDKRSQASLHFALSRHFQLAGDLEQEMAALHVGNAIMAELCPFDADSHLANVARTRVVYDRSHIAALAGTGSDGFKPVFILSLPRSGSTLLEQALARHPLASAAGEANFVGDTWHRMFGSRAPAADPSIHERLSLDQLQEFRALYMEEVARAGITDASVMIHKGINNHKVAGLLAAAFPGARFIGLTRSPLDVAYGCYRQNFEFQRFSFTVAGCAAEIALYEDNMTWWQQQLAGRLSMLSYEHLVGDFDGQLRGLIDWLGLPWDDACLDFGRQSRVGTASVNQVRAGVFRTAVGRAQKYGELFAPFVEALRERQVDIS